VVVSFVVAWAAWQPLRSLNASNDALAALERGDLNGARALAEKARDRDPLALDPWTVLAIVDTRQGDKKAALRSLEREVELQPGNHEVWLRLADFQLYELDDPEGAVAALDQALYLDPVSKQIRDSFIEARARLRLRGDLPPEDPQ
jgi:tetratricopeptide (TPR) repeat protein